MKILIIRPQPGNDASAARAREAGFTAIQLPLFEVRARNWDAPDPAHFDALLITSANAVRHAGPQLNIFLALPVHAVGSNSARVAAAAGLKIATIGTAGVASALENARVAGHRRLLWLTAEDQMASEAPADMQVDPRIVYASEPASLDDNADEKLREADIVALHSARAARQFADWVGQVGLDRNRFYLAAFSHAIAKAAGEGWRGIAIADRPEDQALLSAVHALVRVDAGNGSQGDED